MATDATGVPTSLGIPKFDPNADAPSGLGGNAQMDSIDTLLKSLGIASLVANDVPVYDSVAGKFKKAGGSHTGSNFLRDDGTWAAPSISPPLASVFNSVVQSITNNTETTVTFDSETLDTDTIHDTVTNNSRLTCKTAGTYLVLFVGDFTANATGVRYGLIRKNGTTQLGPRSDVSSLTAGANGTVQGWTLASLAVNDYVEVRVFQNSGGSLNFDATTTPAFAMYKVG
jgi:hypothetical protein